MTQVFWVRPRSTLGVTPHLRPPQSGLRFEGWQIMPDELVSWASASGENQSWEDHEGTYSGRPWEGQTRRKEEKRLPRCCGRDGLDLPGAYQEVAGVGSGRDQRVALLLNLQRIRLVRTGHTKQRLRWEPAFLSHLSWESTSLRSVRTSSPFGVWGAPEPQVRACSPLLSSLGHVW